MCSPIWHSLRDHTAVVERASDCCTHCQAKSQRSRLITSLYRAPLCLAPIVWRQHGNCGLGLVCQNNSKKCSCTLTKSDVIISNVWVFGNLYLEHNLTEVYGPEHWNKLVQKMISATNAPFDPVQKLLALKKKPQNKQTKKYNCIPFHPCYPPIQ